MSSAWLPIRTVNLIGAPPDSWLATISIGRSPAYFSFNNRLGYNIAIPWECQLKTVENYLLIPAVLDRALARAALDRATRTGEAARPLPCSDDLLRTLTDELRDEVQSQYIARRTTYLRSTGKDLADITRETLAWFTPRWNDLTA